MRLFGNSTTLEMPDPRPLLLVDRNNPAAVELAQKFSKLTSKDPNMILVIGGDGFMLDALRSHSKKALPFFGINTGHKGFLLNDPSDLGQGIPERFKIYDLPLLEVEAVLTGGRIKRLVAFNDFWVERATAQSAWIEVKINDEVRLPKLVADAVLLATPTGSTAYARSMGAWPIPLDSQTLVLVGSNVYDPTNFKPCYLPLWSKVSFRTLDTKKRPLRGMVDGKNLGKVLSMTASVSRTASVQLANVGKYGLPEKLLSIQFPS